MGGGTIRGCVMLLACSALAGCGEVEAPYVAEIEPSVAEPAGCGAKEMPAADRTIELSSGGSQRFVVVHAPPDYDPSTPTPLVLAYHYFSGAPAGLRANTGLDGAADAAGVLIAYPVGTDGSFNAGKCCGDAWEQGVDDVAFTRDLLDAVQNTYCIDSKRVYATGMSNGAMMAYRLGCELADRIAGVASVAGALHMDEPCSPSRPVPLLAIHGTEDTSVPYAGGLGQPGIVVPGDLMFTSVSENVEVFRAANGCSDAVQETYHAGDASCRAFTGCEAGATVELCPIEGGGHTWPGGSFPEMLGKTSTDLDASAKIMSFFGDHTLK